MNRTDDLENQSAENLSFSERSDNPKLHKNQRNAAIALGVFSLLVLVLMVVQFRHNINSPFVYSNQKSSTANGQVVADESLRTKDSDVDKLSDYDELYVYKTSPYLEDSDSDGFNDYEEIKNGSDPLCPAGQVCTDTETTQSQIISPDMIDTSVSTTSNNSTSSSDEVLVQSLLEGGSDASALRQLLINAGMDKNILDSISDEDLLKSYQDTLTQQNETQTNSQ